MRPYVYDYQDYAERASGGSIHRELPSGRVPLIVSFGEGYVITDPREPQRSTRARSFIAGMCDSYVMNESPGATHGMQIDLTPLGARMIMGRPMHEITNRVVPLDDVFGAEGIALTERIHDAADADARFAIIEAFIERRLAAARPPSEGMAWAWHRLNETNGRQSIAALATALGVSGKHLIAQFREQIGLPPKTVARILRFSRAVRMARAEREPRWISIALACGYYDQAHLIREFGEFAGDTPVELSRRLRDDGSVDG